MKKIQVLERGFKAAKKAKIFVCLVQYIIYYINWKNFFCLRSRCTSWFELIFYMMFLWGGPFDWIIGRYSAKAYQIQFCPISIKSAVHTHSISRRTLNSLTKCTLRTREHIAKIHSRIGAHFDGVQNLVLRSHTWKSLRKFSLIYPAPLHYLLPSVPPKTMHSFLYEAILSH